MNTPERRPPPYITIPMEEFDARLDPMIVRATKYANSAWRRSRREEDHHLIGRHKQFDNRNYQGAFLTKMEPLSTI